MKKFDWAKWIFMLPAAFLISLQTSSAETVYVTDDIEITVRTGPSTEHKIVAMTKTGRALELVRSGDGWSVVRTPDGKEGWVLNRYITKDPPAGVLLERAKQEYNTIAVKYKELTGKFEQLEVQKKEAETDLSHISKSRDEISAAYELLKEESSDFVNLKQRYQEVTAELKTEKSRSAKLDTEVKQLRNDYIIHWVVAGAGIMLVGFIIGLFSSRGRKQRSIY